MKSSGLSAEWSAVKKSISFIPRIVYYLFHNEDGVVKQLPLEERMHRSKEDLKMRFTITEWNDDGNALPGNAIGRLPTTSWQQLPVFRFGFSERVPRERDVSLSH